MERLREEDSMPGDTSSSPGLGGPPSPNRMVYVNGRHKYCSNEISTAKYNLLSFMPKFLFEQFRRYSNTFFLFIALMQQIPGVSPTGRYTTAVPLIFILAVSAIKEVFEDLKRHRADSHINGSKVFVLDHTTVTWAKKLWADVMVGDVVKVMSEQFFPSDLVLLSSSEPNGMCYIETANLDGETNLKIRQSLASTYECITREKVVQELHMSSIECDPPNKHLYEFKGTFKIHDQIFPLTPDQILLRGAKLKNCNWVFGCVVYSGHETKLMMNSMLQAPLKQSKVDKLTNTHILSLFAILAAIAAVSTVASVIWNHNNGHWYLGIDITASNPLFTFLTFIILYNNLIPISLQVTLEVVRFIQAQFINSDLEMYDEESDTPAMARTSNLNEELGQVRYILSDKTGTLTRNIMEFKQCSVAGKVFAEPDFDEFSRRVRTPKTKEDHVMREWLTLLAVCHTVVPELRRDEGDGDNPTSASVDLSDPSLSGGGGDLARPGPGPAASSQQSDGGILEESTKPDSEIKYQAASPDEGALVIGAAKLGFTFTTRTPSSVFIRIFDEVEEEKYEVLNVLEFTSDRKRMSVIVRCPNGSIKVFVKGADTVINLRLSDSGKEYKDRTMVHLQHFAENGLRTLCCASYTMDDAAYRTWNKQYQDAIVSDPMVREAKLEEVMDKIESNLVLLGATAVEDKLQVGVPETIDTLLKAGIKVWILTGDKKETAINIGFSCKLLNHGMPLIVLSQDTLDETREAIRETEPNSKAALIIDGTTLRYALASDVKSDLLTIALNCKSVICCRVSPIQKAEIVDLVKQMTNEVTLAIGDGANDVAMIRAANVGIGISGQEGLQAAHAADYSISQFRFLTRLLLVHGTWSLGRLCKLILYSFYKNIALYVIELWFATVSGWSGQTIFERWTIGLYNVIFTAAPPLVIGLFDRQCSAETMVKYPSLYSSHGDLFSPRLFWIWVWSAIYHSLALFWLTFFLVNNDALWGTGLADGGYLVFGNFLYTYVIACVCLKAGLESSAWTVFTHMSTWGSIVVWFLFLVVYSRFWPTLPMASDMSGIDTMLFTSGEFWLGLLLIPFLTLIVDIVYKIVSRTCFKSLADEIMDLEMRSVLTSPSQQTLLSEASRLIRNVFDSTRRKKQFNSTEEVAGGAGGLTDHRTSEMAMEVQHGYAFSFEENPSLPQSQLIRIYDTTKAKPSG